MEKGSVPACMAAARWQQRICTSWRASQSPWPPNPSPSVDDLHPSLKSPMAKQQREGKHTQPTSDRSPAMEALRGVRNLRSAAARVAQLQQQRRVSTQPAKYLKENADTTKLSSEEAAQLGAAKKPPGQNKGPGSFMHQQNNLNTKNNKFFQPWLLPIYPMAGMVAIGVGLAIMTAYRELAVNPGVVIDKDKRTEALPELHEKEWTMEKSRQYAEGSPLRKVSTEHKISPFGRHLDDDVKEGPAILIGRNPGLPGDNNPAHGPGGKGRPLGGNN